MQVMLSSQVEVLTGQEIKDVLFEKVRYRTRQIHPSCGQHPTYINKT